MRAQLAELQPEWLSSGDGRSRMGFSFMCCEHSNCRVECWFEMPRDGGLAVTETAGRQLHQHEGDTWGTLCVYPPVRHQGCLIHVYEGEIAFC